MDALRLSAKHAVRSLWHDKTFALTVLLTFAVCIAANAALFAIVNSVVLRPLPIADANSILLMSNEYPKAGAINGNSSSSGDYYDRLKEMPAFESLAVFRQRNQTIELNGAPEQLTGMVVTPSWFRLLRIAPALGRPFNDAEGEIGSEQKVILSYGLWQQLYGGDKSAVGRDLRVSGKPYQIVGVMPRDFNFINPEVRLWMPAAFTGEDKTVHHSNNWTNIGRLKPGATLQQAQAQVNVLNAENMERMPQFKEILINAGFHTDVKPLQDMLTAGIKGTLYLLWGGALLVLLIGGLNIVNLAMARLARKRKEMATRMALGAGHAQLMRQLVLENLGLAFLGGVTGVALGAILLRTLNVVGLEHLPRASEVRMDLTVVLVSLALSLAAGMFVALFLLASVTRISINDALHEDSRTGTTGKQTRGVRRLLVAAQIGFAFALLVGAGLLLASFRMLLHVDPGFKPDGVVTAAVSLPRAKYPEDKQVRDFMNRALPALRAIPGVTRAGAAESIPLGNDHNDSVILAEGYQMKPGESLISPLNISISPGYFDTMGIAIVRGRAFEDRDNETAQHVIIVDETLAQHFWPGQDPIGRRMYNPSDAKDLLKIDEHTRWFTVVGVAHGLRYENLDGTGAPFGAYYFPMAQSPSHGFTFVAKSTADSNSIVRELRSEIAGIDPDVAVFDAHSMNERIDLSLSSRKTSMVLANAFGGVALFLASLGIYGVLAYIVAQRTREMGIRVALGSTRGAILGLVLGEGFKLVAIGLVLGIIGAVSLQKAVANEVYGVRPLDPLVLASVMGVLAVVALAACAIPARRATRVDPIVALRSE
ncbi:MAG TPA: ABC transporter permease [Candidatus Acidoferrum sp.]|jgi:predicted permease